MVFRMQALAENIWWCGYPLKALGVDFRRNVTVVRLSNGDLVVHSTAPFAPADVAEIRKAGPVRWLLDAMLDHDTFAKAGRQAFPEATFLAPDGFSQRVGFSCQPLVPAPPEWGQELEVLRIEGAPAFSEHVFFHRPSRTLIVADLIMNFEEVASPWARLLVRAGIGADHNPGTSRRLKLAIKDRPAFRASIAAMLKWDFDRVVVGHGSPLTQDAKARVVRLFERDGWLT